MERLFLSVSKGTGGLGDVLILTSICKQTPCLVELPNKVKRFTRLFENLTPLQFSEEPTSLCVPQTLRDITHFLAYLGLDPTNNLPYINIFERDFPIISKLRNKYEKAVVFKPHAAGINNVRSMLDEKFWEPILTDLKNKGFKIIQFGVSQDNYLVKNEDFQHSTKFKLADELLLDLSIEELIHHYAAIQNYVGIDTGDYHLMLAVGGKTVVFYPTQTNLYFHQEWDYNSPRVKYFAFEEMTSIFDYNQFFNE